MENRNEDKKSSNTGCIIGLIILVLVIWSFSGFNVTKNGWTFNPVDGIVDNIGALLIIIGGLAVFVLIIKSRE